MIRFSLWNLRSPCLHSCRWYNPQTWARGLTLEGPSLGLLCPPPQARLCRAGGLCPLGLDHALGNQDPKRPCKVIWAFFESIHKPVSHVYFLPRHEGEPNGSCLLGYEGPGGSFVVLCGAPSLLTHSISHCGRSWRWEVKWGWAPAWTSGEPLNSLIFKFLLKVYLWRREARTWLVY